MLALRGVAGYADSRSKGSPIMTADKREFAERLGQRSIQLLVLASGLAFMVLVAGWTVLRIMALLRSGLGVRATLLGLALLVVFAAWLRVISLNWSAAQEERSERDMPVTPADADEGTGIWGVGGPAMREPGHTGTWPRRMIDRRYGDNDP